MAPQFRCPLRHQVVLTPDATAIWLNNRKISYVGLDWLVSDVQRQLTAAGLQTDGHLAVIGGNTLESLLLLIACLRSAVVYFPINPRLPDSQLESLVISLDCDAFYMDEGLCERKISIPSATMITLQVPDRFECINRQAPLPELFIDGERLCDFVLTSGSSGKAKAAGHCYRNHYYSARGSQAQISLGVGDGWLLSLPLFHVGGYAIVIRCLLVGATMVLVPAAVKMAQVLTRFPVTHLSLVNTQLYRLLNDAPFSLANSQLKVILIGGGYVSSDLVVEVKARGIGILTSYGLTEASSQVCTGKPVFLDRQRLTSGRPLPYRQIRVSHAGEILVRGEVLFKGYYQAGGHCCLSLEDGWFDTGDIGFFTDEGYLVVTGRRDNMFISGGENVQPEEIEKVLLALTGVRQAVVVPVPDREYGQRSVAFVDSDIPNDHLNSLRSGLALHLARFKMPEWIYPWPEELASGGLKINRRMFRVLAESRCNHQE